MTYLSVDGLAAFVPYALSVLMAAPVILLVLFGLFPLSAQSIG